MRTIVNFSKSVDTLSFLHFTLKYLLPNYSYTCFLLYLQFYKFLSLTKGEKKGKKMKATETQINQTRQKDCQTNFKN